MNKPTIIVKSFNKYILYLLLSEQFNIVEYDPDANYDIKNSLVMISLYNDSNWWEPLYYAGIKLVIDNLVEPIDYYKKNLSQLDNNYYVLNNINWFWYDESLAERETYNYTTAKTYKKLALMPIHRRKQHRTNLYNAMQPYLNDCVYSYVELGIYLPNDQNHDGSWDRYCNINWYNDTYFSLVAETWADDVSEYTNWGGTSDYSGPYPFITEKTMKPLAYRHPFMIYGQTNTLQHLHSLGFETFENLFDESYDQITNSNLNQPDLKLAKIIDNVKNFVRQPYDKLTLDKIEHNYHLHFNKHLVKQRVLSEIIQPLLHYANE